MIKAIPGSTEATRVFSFLPKRLKNRKQPRISRSWLISIMFSFCYQQLKELVDKAKERHDEFEKKNFGVIKVKKELKKAFVAGGAPATIYNNPRRSGRKRTYKPKYAKGVDSVEAYLSAIHKEDE